MEISLGRLRLNITASRAPEQRKGWEETPAVGMDDRELARLNQAHTRDLDATTARTRPLYSIPRRV
jgi:hypothetical protein